MPIEEELKAKKPKKSAAPDAAESSEQSEKSTERINPELDKKLNEFIEKNQGLYNYYQDLPKERLVRMQMLRKMEQSEYLAQKNQPLVDWVEANPDVKAAIEEKLKNVSEERRPRIFINIARGMAADAVVKPQQPVRMSA